MKIDEPIRTKAGNVFFRIKTQPQLYDNQMLTERMCKYIIISCIEFETWSLPTSNFRWRGERRVA